MNAARAARLAGSFRAAFGRGPEGFYSAPGRTELVGNHTDHQRGRVLAAAVGFDMLAAAAPNGLNTLRVISEGQEPCEVDISDTSPRAEERFTSAALARGIADSLRRRGFEPRGMDIAVTSAVPVGSGLSSSAAFEVLLACILSGGAGPVELAVCARRAENEYFGKPCGLMDQLACASGGVAAMDFAEPGRPAVEHLRLEPREFGHRLCLVSSGAGHEDLTAEYAAIPAEMRAVAEYFGCDALRGVDVGRFWADIPRLRAAVGDRAVLRAVHFFAEDRRAAGEAEAIRAGDFARFLALVRESGRSSAMYLQNLAPAGSARSQPLLLAQAVCERALRGRGAVRVHGGGFAGTLLAFAPSEDYERFRAEVEAALGPGACRELELNPAGPELEYLNRA